MIPPEDSKCFYGVSMVQSSPNHDLTRHNIKHGIKNIHFNIPTYYCGVHDNYWSDMVDNNEDDIPVITSNTRDYQKQE